MKQIVVVPVPNNTISRNNNKNNNNYNNNNNVHSSTTIVKVVITISLSFLFGCLVSTTILLNYRWYVLTSNKNNNNNTTIRNNTLISQLNTNQCSPTANDSKNSKSNNNSILSQNNISTVLNSVRILVVIVAFDFAQLPHLEEVLSSYHDVCMTTGIDVIDVHIHTTIPYPVWLIDLLNSRINCPLMTIQIIIKPKILRLHLVDCHRTTFYNLINDYDLFIYTEDDIRVTATTIATYLYETKIVQAIVQEYNEKYKTRKQNKKKLLQASDYNIGIVRYEYNFPSNVVIDDNTRHATQNVTRVYWEHSGTYERPDGVIPNAVRTLNDAYHNNNDDDDDDIFNGRYVTMKNHHQGMFIATRELLIAWKERGPRCDFATIRNRPGTAHQPSQGTQRVWMSSVMLYGRQHCNVQQLLPATTFGTVTVLHIPNKNYRRVGKYRKRIFKNGTEVFVQPHSSLLTAIQLHVAVRKYKYSLQHLDVNNPIPYNGAVTMIDDVTEQFDRTMLLERRMAEYNDYVKRGGILIDDNIRNLDLIESDFAE